MTTPTYFSQKRLWQTLIITGLSISAIVHVSQLFIYPLSLSVIIVALFGIAYAGIVLMYLKGMRIAPLVSAILPAIGATLGMLRYFIISPNTGSIIDVLIDIFLVIPESIYLWKITTKTSNI